MKNKNLYLLQVLFVLFINALQLNAQTVSNPVIYNAYVSGDMNKWAAVIHTLEKEQPSTLDKKLELTSYYYGYIGFLLGAKKPDIAQKYLTNGSLLIDDIIKHWPKNATAYAYKGSFIGFKIALSKFKALTQGGECVTNLDKALKIEPQNIQANIDKGNMLFHTPRLFGGDKKLALKYFIHGVNIIEKNKLTDNNWVYLYALSLTARTYEYLNQFDNAKITYDKILRIEPNYKWVKNVLLPALNTKMK